MNIIEARRTQRVHSFLSSSNNKAKKGELEFSVPRIWIIWISEFWTLSLFPLYPLPFPGCGFAALMSSQECAAHSSLLTLDKRKTKRGHLH